jgi:hypothetical protein
MRSGIARSRFCRALLLLVIGAQVIALGACARDTEAGPGTVVSNATPRPARTAVPHGRLAPPEPPAPSATPCAAPCATSTAESPPATVADAALPPLPRGWPASLQLGMMDSPGGAATMVATAPFAFRYQYLAGGANTGSGWATWSPSGQFVTAYIQESIARNVVPVFTYYMIHQSTPGNAQPEADGIPANLGTRETMAAYFSDLRLFFQSAGAFPRSRVVLHVEPDMWAYMQRRASDDDAATVPAKVAATGLPELAGLPDTMAGFAQAIVLLRDRYGPNVLLGYHASAWGTGFDIVHRDLSDVPVGAVATRAARAYLSLGAHFDLAFAEFSDRDAAFKQYVYKDGGASWWNAADYRRHIRFLARFVYVARVRVVLWQIPYGNTRMRAMDNSRGHYQDDKVEWLLDDSDGSHVGDYVDAGVIGLLFGQGAADTTCPCDAMRDGVTNPPPIGGNDRASLSTDDDGGYFREKAAAFYASAPPALPMGR